MSRFAIIAAAALVLVSPAVAPRLAAAEEPGSGLRGWGPRVGLTLDNFDQVHFGGHLDFGNIASHIRFQPNVEIGVGDDITFVAINAEAAYRFASRWDVWAPYAGGGLGFDIISLDGPGESGSNTDIGFSALGGIEKGLSSGHRFFTEMKIGLVDAPDIKITAGWTFPL